MIGHVALCSAGIADGLENGHVSTWTLVGTVVMSSSPRWSYNMSMAICHRPLRCERLGGARPKEPPASPVKQNKDETNRAMSLICVYICFSTYEGWWSWRIDQLCAAGAPRKSIDRSHSRRSVVHKSQVARLKFIVLGISLCTFARYYAVLGIHGDFAGPFLKLSTLGPSFPPVSI